MKTSITIIIALIFGFISFASNNSTIKKDTGAKITICHIPPGNPENAHPITISLNALNAHLAHGDSIGNCQIDQ